MLADVPDDAEVILVSQDEFGDHYMTLDIEDVVFAECMAYGGSVDGTHIFMCNSNHGPDGGQHGFGIFAQYCHQRRAVFIGPSDWVRREMEKSNAYKV